MAVDVVGGGVGAGVGCFVLRVPSAAKNVPSPPWRRRAAEGAVARRRAAVEMEIFIVRGGQIIDM